MHSTSFAAAYISIDESTASMTSPHPEPPSSEPPGDLEICHALIERLQKELQAAIEQVTTLQAALAEAQEAAAGDAQEAAARIAHLEALLSEHQETISAQQQTIEDLAGDIELLKRALYGNRRERYTDDPGQGVLFDVATLDPPQPGKEDEQSKKKKKRKKRTSRGRRRRVFPEFLPREEQKHELRPEDIPEELRDHPRARRFFKKVGETLEIVPMQFKVVEQYQEVIALDQPDATTIMVAARRPTPLVQSYAGDSLLSYLTVSRFADHLPYYRLEDVLGRSGFRIDRGTQWRWMRGVARGVTPLVEMMWDRVRQSNVLGMDETPVMELGGPGRALKGYLWVGVGDANHPYDCFFYSSDRRSIRPEAMLSGFEGYLTADAYIAYERIGKLWPGIVNTSCWAHGRRKFEACHHLGSTYQTHTALAYFRQLFDLEDIFRQYDDEARLAARQEKSQPIVEAFRQWLELEQSRQLPKSKLLGAINYMLNRWESFTRFLESGAVPLDNNAAERALKYPILGRKAWLFFGNREAGETAAKLFTLTKSCNRLHIDPFAYLRDVYARLPTTPADELPSLLPDRWLQEHPQHLIPQRIQEALERAQRAREEREERRRRAAA
jgi:transposase